MRVRLVSAVAMVIAVAALLLPMSARAGGVAPGATAVVPTSTPVPVPSTDPCGYRARAWSVTTTLSNLIDNISNNQYPEARAAQVGTYVEFKMRSMAGESGYRLRGAALLDVERSVSSAYQAVAAGAQNNGAASRAAVLRAYAERNEAQAALGVLCPRGGRPQIWRGYVDAYGDESTDVYVRVPGKARVTAQYFCPPATVALAEAQQPGVPMPFRIAVSGSGVGVTAFGRAGTGSFVLRAKGGYTMHVESACSWHVWARPVSERVIGLALLSR
jgi:hypothetical protein